MLNQDQSVNAGTERLAVPSVETKPTSELSAAQTREQWLAGLKVGDEIARQTSGGWGSRIHADFLPVTRLTARYIICGSQKFRKDDGHEPGTYRGYYLSQPTDELKATLVEQSRKDEIVPRIERLKWRELSVATLEAILALAATQDTNTRS